MGIKNPFAILAVSIKTALSLVLLIVVVMIVM